MVVAQASHQGDGTARQHGGVYTTIPPDGIDVHDPHADVLLTHGSNVAYVDAIHLQQGSRVTFSVRAQIGESLRQNVDIGHTECISITANVHR